MRANPSLLPFFTGIRHVACIAILLHIAEHIRCGHNTLMHLRSGACKIGFKVGSSDFSRVLSQRGAGFGWEIEMIRGCQWVRGPLN